MKDLLNQKRLESAQVTLNKVCGLVVRIKISLVTQNKLEERVRCSRDGMKMNSTYAGDGAVQ